jgi:hypothetical protein
MTIAPSPPRSNAHGNRCGLAPALLALLMPLALHAQPASTGTCLRPAELQLATLLNAHRVSNGKPAVPVSFSLSSVGQWHVWDLGTSAAWNPPTCNVHSWSGQRPDLWTPVCYTADHAQAAQMWNKPAQITAGFYNSNGYEVAVSGAGITPAQALSVWQGSSPHNDVILNNGVWASFPWQAMGVGLSGGFAVAWFGTLADPLGTMTACGEQIFASGFEPG